MTVLESLKSTGSVWLPDDEFKDTVDLRAKNLLHYKGFTTLDKIGDMESQVAENILRLKNLNKTWRINEEIIDAYIDEFEQNENNGRSLDYKQRAGVKMAVVNFISILTGGPGTGKTTVLSCMAYVLRKIDNDIRIVYTAPTGKAANRIKESTGENATTLHKKLGLGGKDVEPEEFWEDVLIIDEFSMTDLWLANALFKALPLGKKIVMVGDVNQLPSVGIGAVLRDMIASNVLPCTKLTKTFRQDDSSTLFTNIQNIRNGIVKLIKGNDFHYFKIPTDTPRNKIAQALLKTYLRCVKKYGVDNVCLLVPYRRNIGNTISSDYMSPIIQKVVNTHNGGCTYSNLLFKKDDLVMQLVNRAECANGDVGKVIEASSNEITVLFTDTKVSYKGKDLEQLALAYSMTIHKAQGSEYMAVIMCILDSHKKMLNRNVLYTGITRAKKECYLFYQEDALETAITTIADEVRYSFLAAKMERLDIEYRVAKYF